jgi:hypothetical protein
VTVNVNDGMMNVSIAKGSQSYGGYINGMDIMPVGSAPLAEISLSGSTATVTAENVSKAVLIHVMHKDKTLEYVKSYPLVFINGKASVSGLSVLSGDKLMVWSSVSGVDPLGKVYLKK